MARPSPINLVSPSHRRRSVSLAALLLGLSTLSSCRLTGSGELPPTSSQTIRTATTYLSDQPLLTGKTAPLAAGKALPNGLAVQAGSTLEYNVGAQCRTFSAQIGLASSAAADSTVTYSVLADGRSMFGPSEVRSGAAPQTVNVDIEGVERLKLVVESKSGAKSVQANWKEAKLSGCVTYSGPIEVGPSATSPIVITGNFRSDDPKVPAIRIETTQPVVIRNCTVAGRGHLISNSRAGANVKIQNCRGFGLNPYVRMVNPGRFVAIEDGSSLVVENSYLKNTGGIYLLGGSTRTTTIKILRNRALNIDGRRSDGAGGWLIPAPGDNPEKFVRAQFVQFNKVVGVSDAEIAWNRVENEPGHSRVEDNINMYASSGTPAHRIRIHHNLIRGAYQYPLSLQSYSGGGIITDGCLSRYIDISENTVLETSNHGIAIANGEYVAIQKNRVYGSGLLPDNSFSGGDDNGIYVRWAGNCDQRGINFGSNIVAYNNIGFAQPSAADRARRRDLAIANARSGTPLATATDNSSALPSDSCLICTDSELIKRAITDWEQQAVASGVEVGTQ
ncbi:hypothetical protein CVO96_17415 [Deinococcus koreensis]|uniref:Glycosyl hydrolase family 98 putative carbohydrate-binding module domain-containing protein n=2 Tax=Deinococcus koreensis TaxID=2054903 RepID=A0A2K3UT69_9DEIO|nr:hypothetical protein CVO96_17415 [Deinococcus koreensis]